MTDTLTAVRERPILFSGAMVRALLDGTKTQTRRVVKNVPRTEDDDLVRLEVGLYHPTVVRFGMEEPGDETFGVWTPDGEWAVRCPYGQPGDRLWVREELRPWSEVPYLGAKYAADDKIVRLVSKGGHMETDAAWPRAARYKVVPPMFMTRAYSRLTLEVTGVRVERVQDISNADAIAEGCQGGPAVEGYSEANPADPYEEYAVLWDSLNESRGYGWNANPWVWVVEFARVNA